MAEFGAICFGIVVGWVAYRTLRRSEDRVGLSDIASVIGAIGGGAVVTLFDDSDLFGRYSIGLAIGFFGYLVASIALEGKNVSAWMGAQNDAPRGDGSNVRPTQ